LNDTLQAEKDFSIHDSDCAWDVESIRKEASLTAKQDKKK
jgi:glutathione-regulated potassium-efflux system ancillary protein KefC